MKLAVIGTGYVGLVTAACFAEMGNQVTCMDVDTGRIDSLRDGQVPIHEPGLEPLVARNADAGRLRFSTSLPDAIRGAQVCFVAVGTPAGEDGSADLSQVLAVARDIGRAVEHDLVVVDKSTVPVGTAERVAEAIDAESRARNATHTVEVVSNPEFLAEGVAIDDFMRPDRVIIGTRSAPVVALMHELYAPFCRSREKLIVMGVREAEMTKYAANAMLATRVSFMNEIAGICERLGVDVESVRQGLGADPRIGHRFLYPGAGYGGSCFPKDVRALIHAAEQGGFEPGILHAVEARNAGQKRVLFEKLAGHFGGDLEGRTIAVWGLAFKPGTDDMREASSLTLIAALVEAGATVRAFDPVAQETARRALDGMGVTATQVEIVDDAYAAAMDADALVLVTEWKQFRQPDFDRLEKSLKQPVIVDGRNQYDPATLRARGFSYYGIGR